MGDDDQVIIQHLEIRFDVEGDDDDQAFGRLFGRYIDLWTRAQEEQQITQRRAAADRALGDREAGS